MASVTTGWANEGTDERASGFVYDGVMAGRDVRAGLSRRLAATRPLPMEEICFFVKPIDNSRLARVVDPRSRRECLKVVGVMAALFLAAVLYIVPYLGMVRAGYRIEALKKQGEELAEHGRQLVVKEAAMRDPKRIDAIARRLGLVPAGPEQVVWSDASSRPTGDELLARNLYRGDERK